MTSKASILEYLIGWLISYEMDFYNEDCYQWSAGYRRCLRDVIEKIEQME